MTTKHVVLFVDDEPNILSGLKRMFRPLRQHKDFFFVESGNEALDFISKNHVDVVVSDMRMPGMDGAALLAKIQEQYPQVIRIMLTGQADEDSILRTVGVVHQFIAKPSDPESLREVLERACALQDLMQNENLKSLVAGIGNLPSLPEIYSKLQKKLKEPDCTINDIAALIEQDLAMSAKLLQLVNSSFFGFFKNIDSPARAVALLGLDTVKALVLNVGIFTELHCEAVGSFSVKSLWEHSMTVAAFAKRIAQEETKDKSLIDDVFIAGFMHDIGKLILFSSMQDQYLEAMELAKKEGLTICQAECQILSASHGDIGGYLLGLWGLPGYVVETAAFHHRLDHYPSPSFCPALIVHVADYIYFQLLRANAAFTQPVLNTAYLEQIGLGHRLEAWTEACRQLELQGPCL